MKYFIAIALFAAVASAAVRPSPIATAEMAELQEIIAAINSPNTDPATAAALEEMLHDILGVNKPEPVAVGPEIINPVEGISVGPAIVPFPLPDGGAVAEEPIIPGPVVVAPAPVAVTPAASTPLVQIVLNINQAASSPVAVGPAITPEIKPEPVHVVDSAPEPVQVVEVAPEPVQVVEVAPEPIQIIDVLPEPVQIIEVAPAPAEPVLVEVPVLPEAAVVLPDELN